MWKLVTAVAFGRASIGYNESVKLILCIARGWNAGLEYVSSGAGAAAGEPIWGKFTGVGTATAPSAAVMARRGYCMIAQPADIWKSYNRMSSRFYSERKKREHGHLPLYTLSTLFQSFLCRSRNRSFACTPVAVTLRLGSSNRCAFINHRHNLRVVQGILIHPLSLIVTLPPYLSIFGVIHCPVADD